MLEQWSICSEKLDIFSEQGNRKHFIYKVHALTEGTFHTYRRRQTTDHVESGHSSHAFPYESKKACFPPTILTILFPKKNKELRIKYFHEDDSRWELKQALLDFLNFQTCVISEEGILQDFTWWLLTTPPLLHVLMKPMVGAPQGVLHRDSFSTPEQKGAEILHFQAAAVWSF